MPKSLLAVAAGFAVLAAVIFLYQQPAPTPPLSPAPVKKSIDEDPEISRLKQAAIENPAADSTVDGTDAAPAKGYESPGVIAKKRAQSKRKVIAKPGASGKVEPEEFEEVVIDDPAAPEPAKPQPVITEKAAREALSLVGIDPVAETIWIAAINDPNLSRKDRKNLIEDLNENGFADPRHISADELPLIQARLALIEELAPDAMDDANLAAFQEAYKDLLNMYAKLTSEIENAER